MSGGRARVSRVTFSERGRRQWESSKDALAQACAAISPAGERIASVAADVTREADVQGLVQAVAVRS